YPGIAQFAVEQHGLAEAHVARAGKQEGGRVAFGDVAIERSGGRLTGLSRSGAASSPGRLSRKGAGEARVETIHGVPRVARVGSARARSEPHGAGKRELLVGKPKNSGLGQGASTGSAEHADIFGLVRLE